MAIADYSTLQAEVQRYLPRTDSAYAAAFPQLVTLAEDRVYNGGGREGDALYSPPLRVKVMETIATVSMVDGVGTLPADLAEVRTVEVPNGRESLSYFPPERYSIELARQNYRAEPGIFTVHGSEIMLSTGGAEMSLRYWRRFDPLSPEAPSNALLLTHPTVYFDAVVFESYAWMKAMHMAEAALVKLRATLSGLNVSAFGTRHVGKMRTRTRSYIN